MRAVINWALWVGGGSKNSGVRIAGGDGDAHGVSRFEALARNKVKPKSGRRNWVGLVNDMSRFEALARNKVKSPNRKWKLGGVINGMSRFEVLARNKVKPENRK